MGYYINYSIGSGSIITRYVSGMHDELIASPPVGTANLAATDSEAAITATQPGYTVVGGVLVPPPAPTAAQLLDAAQRVKSAILSASCREQICASFPSSALGTAYTYDCTLTDQHNVGTVSASATGGSIWCADSAGVWAFTVHTQAQAQQVQADMLAHVQAEQSHYATLLDQVKAAATVADVQAIVW